MHRHCRHYSTANEFCANTSNDRVESDRACFQRTTRCRRAGTTNQKHFLKQTLALQLGIAALVEQMLNDGANVNERDEHGFTSLHVATDLGHLSVVEQLLKQKQIDVNAIDNEMKWTALHFAAERDHTQIVQLLLNAKANVLRLHE